MNDTDTDFIIMHIEIKAKYPDGSKETKKFLLKETGVLHKYTAMSKLVGVTASITAKLILEDKIKVSGVIGPY